MIDLYLPEHIWYWIGLTDETEEGMLYLYYICCPEVLMPIDQEFGFGWKVRKKLCTQIGAVVSPTTTMPLRTVRSSPWILTSTLAGWTILVEKIAGMLTAGHCMLCVKYCQSNF